jgi:hypothetical protein
MVDSTEDFNPIASRFTRLATYYTSNRTWIVGFDFGSVVFLWGWDGFDYSLIRVSKKGTPERDAQFLC